MTANEIVEVVRKQYRKYGQELFPGADEAEIQRLKAAVLARYGVELPEGLLDLLRQVNGFGHDGQALYASRPIYVNPNSEFPAEEGIVEMNEAMEAEGSGPPNTVCLGYGFEDHYFGIDRATQKLWEYDLYGKPVRSFDSFEEMFRYMFEDRVRRAGA